MLSLFVVSWMLEVLWAAYLGSRRGRTVLGIVLGILLGLIGVGIIALLKPTDKYKIAQAQDAMRIHAMAFAPPPPPVAPPVPSPKAPGGRAGLDRRYL